jgi:ribosomal protein S3AE
MQRKLVDASKRMIDVSIEELQFDKHKISALMIFYHHDTRTVAVVDNGNGEALAADYLSSIAKRKAN